MTPERKNNGWGRFVAQTAALVVVVGGSTVAWTSAMESRFNRHETRSAHEGAMTRDEFDRWSVQLFRRLDAIEQEIRLLRGRK